MKYLLLFLCILGCSSKVHHRTAIVHDYIIENATDMCKDHMDLHYIVVDQVVLEEVIQFSYMHQRYPCHTNFIFRCQDGTALPFSDGVGYCFISESQLKESLEAK